MDKFEVLWFEDNGIALVHCPCGDELFVRDAGYDPDGSPCLECGRIYTLVQHITVTEPIQADAPVSTTL